MGNPNVAERLVLGERTVCDVGVVAVTEGDRTSGALRRHSAPIADSARVLR